MSKQKFTNKEFDKHKSSFKEVLGDAKVNSYLEVGCHEGKSLCYIADNNLNKGANVYALDTFFHNHDPYAKNWSPPKDKDQYYNQCIENLKKYGEDFNFNIYRNTSNKVLSHLLVNNIKVDLIYWDGEMTSRTALLDLLICDKLLNVGGIMIINNWGYLHGDHKLGYGLGLYNTGNAGVLKSGIQTFFNFHKTEYRVISKDTDSYQIAILKLTKEQQKKLKEHQKEKEKEDLKELEKKDKEKKDKDGK